MNRNDSRTENLIRETIGDLVEREARQARGVDGLAATAMRHGRRMRAGRRVAAAAAGLLAVAVVAAVAVSLPSLRQRGLEPAIVPSPPVEGPALDERREMTLVGGWRVAGVSDWVLDRTDGTYARFGRTNGSERILPAPAGDLVAIIDGESIRITTPKWNRVEEAEGTWGDRVQWSPQGDRLVVPVSQKEPFQLGFAVIEARTGTVRRHWIDLKKYDCGDCAFSWSRDGREVATDLTNRAGGETRRSVTGVQFFDAATGAPTRTVDIKETFAGPFSWSPNGRKVLAGKQIIDVGSGAARPFPYDNGVWADDGLLLVHADGAVLSVTSDGVVSTRWELRGAFMSAGPVSFAAPG